MLLCICIGVQGSACAQTSSSTLHSLKQWNDFYGPQGVAVDSQGNVFVSDAVDNAVYKIPVSGNVVTLGSGFLGPSGVAVDSSGNVYVADTNNNVVQKIPTTGNYVTLGSGLFYQPSGVAVDSTGNVYVADSWNNAVREILANGSIITLGGGFSHPSGVAVDSAGNIYIADTLNNAVKEILANGSVITLGSGFNSPSGVAVDSNGIVYVADTGSNAVKAILGDGTVVTLGSGFSNPGSIAVDPSGDLFVVDMNAVSEFAPALIANFTSNVTSGAAPLSVRFSDISIGGPQAWTWDFGEGSSAVSTQNAVHEYASAGTYDVTLTVSNADSSSTVEKVGYIIVSEPNVHTSFDLGLKQGWNLVSTPLVVDPAINVSTFKGTNVTMVARYNKTTGGFDIYRVGKTPVAFPFIEGQGYFLYCNNNTIYTVSGFNESGQSTTIGQGWNLIGWTSLTASNSKVLAQGLHNVTMLAKYNTTTGSYDIYRVGKTPTPFAIQSGEGYFLYTAYADQQTFIMG